VNSVRCDPDYSGNRALLVGGIHDKMCVQLQHVWTVVANDLVYLSGSGMCITYAKWKRSIEIRHRFCANF